MPAIEPGGQRLNNRSYELVGNHNGKSWVTGLHHRFPGVPHTFVFAS
jgi:hypothetical protein